MADKALPCPTVLRLLLRYEPETGKLFWRERARKWFATDRAFGMWNARYAGREALAFKDNHGYHIGSVLVCRHMKAHRAIWAIKHGQYPSGHIDHVNGDRTDNRIQNLRDTTREQNQRNLKMNARNRSGQVGVFWHSRAKRWWAYIGSGKTRRTIGYYVTKAEAIAARLAAQEAAGFHALHGLTEQERRNSASTSILWASGTR